MPKKEHPGINISHLPIPLSWYSGREADGWKLDGEEGIWDNLSYITQSKNIASLLCTCN